MRLFGHDAYFKDNVLAIRGNPRFNNVTIEGTKYKVSKVEQSLHNKEVFNYYLEEYGG